MTKLLFDRTLNEQVRTTIIYTLNNVYKIRKWISPVIKEKFEKLVILDGIEIPVLNATIYALHSMVINGAWLNTETIERLRHLAINGDNSTIESIHELLDFLDNKRILSKKSTQMFTSNIKKELTATQNTSVSRSEEESVEPTLKLHSMDHLLTSVGHLGQTVDPDAKPIDISRGDNSWTFGSWWQHFVYFAKLAKKGQLKSEDIKSLAKFLERGTITIGVKFPRTVDCTEIISGAFRDAAAMKQAIPAYVLDIIIYRLSSSILSTRRYCAETLLLVMRNGQTLTEQQMEKIEAKLKSATDSVVKQHLIELYALHIYKGHHSKVDLNSMTGDLLNKNTCKATSYIFFKATSIDKPTFSKQIIDALCKVVQSKEYDVDARENCLWSLAYNIKDTEDKTSISTDIIETLSELLTDEENNIKQTAAIGLCHYAIDKNTSLSTKVLERLAVMLHSTDNGLLSNVLSIYLRMSKRGEQIPSIALKKLCAVFYHEEFSIREKAIWLLKYAIDNGQEVTFKIIYHLDECLKDSEFAIRNVAAMIFNSFWRQKVEQYDQKRLRLLFMRMETFMLTIFRQSFSLNVRLSSLDLLQSLLKKNFVLSETLIHLFECCLYNREPSISSKSINILKIYSEDRSLPKSTFVCLEHLLGTETPILSEVISLLRSIVADGQCLSKKTVDILAQLLFKTSKPKEITALLTHADRNQPLSKNVNEFLKQIYYGQILEHSTCKTSLNKAIKNLVHLTSQGQQLSVSILHIIFRKLEVDEQRLSLMPILVNVVANGQSLNNDYYQSILKNIFFENTASPLTDLIEIYTHLSRQNQIISNDIINQLSNYLDNESINHFIIEIYQHRIERQKSLDQSLIENIFQSFFNQQQWKSCSVDLQNQLALFYKALAANRSKDIDQNCLPFLLASDQLISVRKEICTAIRLLTEHEVNLQETTINALINLSDGSDDTDLQQIALEILAHIRSIDRQMDEDTLIFFNLLQYDWKMKTDDEILLEELKRIGKKGMNLSEMLSIRLAHMLLSTDSQIKTDASIILNMALSEREIHSKQILNIIYMTLRDATINMNTVPLLLSSESLPTIVINDLIYLAKNSSDDSVRECAQNILTKRADDNQSNIDLFFEHLNSLEHVNNETDFHQTLKTARAMIIIEKQLPEQVLSLMADNLTDETIDVLLLAHQHNIPFYQCNKIVASIQYKLVFDSHLKSKLIPLIQILADNAISVHEKSIQFLYRTFNEEYDLDALKALESIAENQQLPENILQSFITLISETSNNISISHCLSIIYQQFSQGFIENPTEIIETISLPSYIDKNQLLTLNSFEESLNIIQNILFVSYLESEIFKKPVEQWSRDCLCIEIIANCSEATNDEIICFYQYLTQFENFNNQRDIFLRKLIEKQRTETLQLSTINNILIYATTKSKDNTPLMILKSDQSDWLVKMRVHYIETKLEDLQLDKSLVNHLSQRIAEQEQLSAEFIEPCLRILQSVDDLLAFLDLFTDFSMTRTDLIEIFSHERSPTDFDILQKKMQFLIVCKTFNEYWMGSNENMTLARTLLHKLIKQGWTVSKLLIILKANSDGKMSSDEPGSLIYLNNVLRTFVNYNIDSNIISNMRSIFEQNKVESWPSLVHNRVIEHCLGSGSSEKNLNMLLSEIQQLNSQIDKQDLLNKYEKIQSIYNEGSMTLISDEGAIESWSKSTIQQWAEHVRSANSSEQPSIFEIIAVMKRAVYLDSKFEPRPVQILSLLILLDTKEQGGRLVQILTGEGKSTVVSMLAVIKALQNEHVDIITSSITLAKRDAHEKRTFYDYFKLTVSHNNDETSYTSGQKDCYHANIVYGNSSQFQFDLLRHEFNLLNTR